MTGPASVWPPDPEPQLIPLLRVPWEQVYPSTSLMAAFVPFGIFWFYLTSSKY